MKRFFLLNVLVIIILVTGCQQQENVNTKQLSDISWNEDIATVKRGNWYFTVHKVNEKEVFITKVEYLNDKTEQLTLEIPAKLGEYSVVGVGEKMEWAPEEDDFSHTIFGGSVESAHSDSCESELSERITKLVLPEGLQVIECGALGGLLKVKEVKIPDSVVTVGYEAFFSCPNLTKVTMGAKVSELVTSAFNQCKKLECIDIDANNQVYGIEDGMVILKKENKLYMVPGAKERITIPEQVTDIEQGALDSGRLKEINVTESNKALAKDGNCIYYKKNKELLTVEAKRVGKEDRLIISPKVKMISEKAMSVGARKEKKRVIVGENVKKVSGSWMDFCANARTYEFKSATPPKVVNLPYGCSGVPVSTTIYVPKGAKENYMKWLIKFDEKPSQVREKIR